MRRMLLVAGGVAGVIVLLAALVVGYALINLNSLIAANRDRILARASDTLGRPVAAAAIRAHLGWGVAIDLSDVTIADDPAFAPGPFVSAGDVFLKVEFLPLLSRELRVTELVLKQPRVNLIADARGRLNVATLAQHTRSGSAHGLRAGGSRGAAGARAGMPMESAAADAGGPIAGVARLTAISIRTFTIDDGTVTFTDRRSDGPPVTIARVNLDVGDFNFTAPFTVKLTLAAFGDRRNLDLTGTVGPIVSQGAIDLDAIAIALTLKAGPLTLAQLESVPPLARAIPPALVISDALALRATISGSVNHPRCDATGDLTANRVAWLPRFDKPVGVPLTFAASGAWVGGAVVVREAKVTLASLVATLTDIALAGRASHARVDTNQFALAPVAALVAAAAQYHPSGTAIVHSAVALGGARPTLHGTVTLEAVSIALPKGKAPPISQLTGTIRMAGNSASVDPLTFKLGSGNARLAANASSLQPFATTWRLTVDQLVLGELMVRPPANGDERVRQLTASGNLSFAQGQLSATARASAAAGLVANVAFTNLALDAGYAAAQVTLNSLALEAFGGSIDAAGVATVGAAPSFDLQVNTRNVDLHQALESQQAKAAKTIRGLLTANLQIAGQGRTFDEIKPRLRGRGRATLTAAKLVGVNIVAQGLRKVDGLPGLDVLVPPSVIANHPELFQSPDTDIQSASLTFLILAGRIISNDIVVRSPDYSLLAHGWFDFDKHIDLVTKVVMSRPFSDELVAAQRNAAFLTDSASQIEIPLRVTGQLPKPTVSPDLGNLAQRAAGHAVENKLGGLLGKKGLGGLLGGGGGGSGSSGGGFSNPFKGLFH